MRRETFEQSALGPVAESRRMRVGSESTGGEKSEQEAPNEKTVGT